LSNPARRGHAGGAAGENKLGNPRLRAPPAYGGGWFVIVACPPTSADPAALMTRIGANALLTHDAGTDWPDAAGARQASAVLAEGGVVGLAFEKLADALACRARLLREGAGDGR
jgi:hypothetical protein